MKLGSMGLGRLRIQGGILLKIVCAGLMVGHG